MCLIQKEILQLRPENLNIQISLQPFSEQRKLAGLNESKMREAQLSSHTRNRLELEAFTLRCHDLRRGPGELPVHIHLFPPHRGGPLIPNLEVANL